MTKLMYIKHPNLFESSAEIIHHGSDCKGMYFALNQSLFYPQGGGQPADQGVIISEKASYSVFDVRNVDDGVRHYIVDDNLPIHPSCAVTIKVDRDRRVLNSKYHTAGHLIASVVEKIHPELKAIKGHQFPGEAYVEFDGTVNDVDNFIAKIASHALKCITSNAAVKIEELSPANINTIAKELPYKLPKDKPLRVCRITGFSPVPCGGTHVQTLEDIASLSIKKYRSKRGKTKVYYGIK